MSLTAYARLEQFRSDIEKLLAQKECAEQESDRHDHIGEEKDEPAADGNAGETPPDASKLDAVAIASARNFFKVVDDALLVLN